MTPRATKVTLVLDPTLGGSIASLDLPLWVCDSPINRPVVERLRSERAHGGTALTVFTPTGSSPEQVCADIVATVDEHHPGWTELAVVGASASPDVRASLASFEPGRFVETGVGFSFVRDRLHHPT
jgi:hypothetical protein